MLWITVRLLTLFYLTVENKPVARLTTNHFYQNGWIKYILLVFEMSKQKKSQILLEK